jgi:hypothetical protein
VLEPLPTKLTIDAPHHIILSLQNLASFLALVSKEKFVKTFIRTFAKESKTGETPSKEELLRLKNIADQTYDDMLTMGKSVIDNVGAVAMFDVSVDFKKALNPDGIDEEVGQQKTKKVTDDLFGDLELPEFDLDG